MPPLDADRLTLLAVLAGMLGCCSTASGKEGPSLAGPYLAQAGDPNLIQVQRQPKSPAITLEELKDEESFSGAGIVFQLESEPRKSSRIIFAYSTYDDATGMRINNQLVKLKHIRSKTLKAGKGSQGLGKHVLDTWSNDLITVVFDYRITSTGERGVGLRGHVTIKINSEQATFLIIGGIGC